MSKISEPMDNTANELSSLKANVSIWEKSVLFENNKFHLWSKTWINLQLFDKTATFLFTQQPSFAVGNDAI